MFGEQEVQSGKMPASIGTRMSAAEPGENPGFQALEFFPLRHFAKKWRF